ncbi:MAG: DUF1232 domain-containing protein [Alistipes sp.]|nr:DUF1232 domain-containing protein [Alistipes sp.]MBQ5619055.1 DUF1232 domain-containing protein [Alistipes sp.]MBQ5923472.1 DUF1232 domain-containing protein [Alistipes sp.]
MKPPKNIERYGVNYSEKGLLSKLSRAVRWANAKIIYAALLLYYVLRNDAVTMADKSKIYGALGYFILPTDMVLDFIPMVGYTDDMAALMWAIHTLTKNLTPEIKAQARLKFGEIVKDYDEKKIDEIG